MYSLHKANLLSAKTQTVNRQRLCTLFFSSSKNRKQRMLRRKQNAIKTLSLPHCSRIDGCKKKKKKAQKRRKFCIIDSINRRRYNGGERNHRQKNGESQCPQFIRCLPVSIFERREILCLCCAASVLVDCTSASSGSCLIFFFVFCCLGWLHFWNI